MNALSTKHIRELMEEVNTILIKKGGDAFKIHSKGWILVFDFLILTRR